MEYSRPTAYNIRNVYIRGLIRNTKGSAMVYICDVITKAYVCLPIHHYMCVCTYEALAVTSSRALLTEIGNNAELIYSLHAAFSPLSI